MGGSEQTNKGGKERSGMGRGGTGALFSFSEGQARFMPAVHTEGWKVKKNKEEE